MENLNIGISLTIVGLGTVFLVLYLLQITMTIETRLIDNWLAKPQKDNNPNTTPNPVTTTTPVTEPQTTPTTIPTQHIAAIMGAIAYQLGQPTQNLRLVQVRQLTDKEAATPWTLAGRINNINTRSRFYTKGGTK